MNKWAEKLMIIFLIIVSLMLCISFKMQDKILIKIYPKKYSEYVYKYSKEYNVDPLLVFAIIKAESNFKSDAISTSDAVGLMQLIDTTAEETSKKLNIEYKKEMLQNPEKNVMFGIKYFSTLVEKYDNITIALTAYNAGKRKCR